MLKVLVHKPFTDKYTGKDYEKGKEYPFSEERVQELKSFDIGLIEVLGKAPEEKPKKAKAKSE